jgi:peptidoglycan hydrolase-like protein with peptidoglycan-binding domain
MATYNQVSYGSKGSTVTELQKLLNQNGYNLAVDGQFGSKTQAAVKDYQQKNSLAVDGIVGNNTWGALTKASAPAAPTTPTTPTTTTPSTTPATQEKKAEFSYGDYKPSDAVTQAEQMLNQQLAQKPGAYQSTWQDQLNDTLQQILNREKFSYDLNGDALYQQYKDQYVTQGKMAMMDTMGQAQAMTGGYGNSYAQSVGQQAYQGHLQQLNDKIPELYQLAMNQYQMEGDALTDRYAMLAQQENQDYGRFRDQMGDWQTERDYLTGRYDSERDLDYGKWADGRDFAYGQFADDRAYDYQTGRDKVEDERWQSEFDEAKRQFDQQYALKTGSSGGGSSGGTGGSGGSGGSYDAETAALQEKLNAMGANLKVDGIMGPQTKAAYEKYMGGSPEPEPAPTRDFKWVTQQADNYISAGASKSEISNFLTKAKQAGYITQAQYTSLKSLYVPRGLTY